MKTWILHNTPELLSSIEFQPYQTGDEIITDVNNVL